MAKTDKKVHIIERDGEFVADPGSMKMVPDETLKIVNQTQEDLLWVVMNPAVFGAVVSEPVKAQGLSTAKKAGGVAGVYEYQIMMLKSGKKAKGNSDPVIIIDTAS